ncbi:MAG: hypothetical protein K0R71_1504 [Bacillales bacterium]|nr:hypothetical protein [Bacillales bacterium]
MFIIASFLLNAGLLVVINYGGFFNTLKKELSPADVYYMLPDTLYTDEVKSYLHRNEHIQKIQTNEMMLLDSKISSKGKMKSFNILFNNMDEQRELSKWKFVGDHLPAEEMSVYVPDIFKAVSGYQLNDKIKLKYTDKKTATEKTLSFTVKGYTEDIFFSSHDTGFMGFYLTSDTYQKVADIINNPNNNMHVVFTNLDLNSASLLAGDVSSMFVVIDLELVEMARCMMASMVSVMMVVFSMIIVIVCLLVVRFRIVNSIEDDVTKIGSLKAIGYTSRQIILSVILQFSLLAGIGCIIGIALSYPALPAVATVFEQQSGLKWEQGFDGVISSSALFILLFIVVLVAWIAARRLSRLNPINALRGETSTHGYKRNYLPLENTKGHLTIVLAFKSVLQSMKQNIMIGVILIAVTFAGTFGLIMFYNTTIDTKAFAEVPGMEICNAIAVLNPEKDHAQAVKKIESMDHVRKTQYLDEVKIKIEGGEASAFVMDDYSKKESKLVYEGRYPKTHNEITLAGVLAERLHKKIDDTVTVNFGEREETFKVVGLSNGSSMGGINASILSEDFRQLNPDYKQQALYIYLEKGTDAAGFVEQLKGLFDKELLLGALNFDKQMAEGMASYQNIVAAMGIAMLVITLLVVTLVLYFVISSSVIRKKRELGIQKAIGFTTFQLMNQLAVSFTVPIIFGAVIGTLLGSFYTNALMSVSMKGMGVMRAGFIVNPYWTVGFGVAIILLSYLLSLLITLRIRKISAYTLVTE